MVDEDLLAAIRSVVREELQAALKVTPVSTVSHDSHRSEFDLRAIALKMGLDIFPRNYRELIDKYKNSGNLPVSMKESWQRFKDWSDSENGRIAASFSHRAYLDSVADRRNKLKAEGKWQVNKKSSKKSKDVT